MSDLTEEMRRHSAAHLTARAIQNVFEDVQVDIGPATDDGFYYDFDLPHRLSPEDFPKIEAEIARLIALDEPFVKKVVSREECARMLAGQKYKLERLADIPEGEDNWTNSYADTLSASMGLITVGINAAIADMLKEDKIPEFYAAAKNLEGSAVLPE